MRRGYAGWAGVVLAVGLLSGCGDDGAAYCTQLQADQEELAEMSENPASGLVNNLPRLRNLADKAPDDLVDEWQTLINAVEQLDTALDEADVDPDDYRDGKPPKGLSAADQKAIGEAGAVLASEEVVVAAGGIEQQARDVCKLQMGL